MTAKIDWQGLIVQSLRNPRGAAAEVISWQLPRATIWTALVLVATLNALLGGLSELIFPSPLELPGILRNPLAMLIFLGGGLVIMIHAMTWAGRAMGGQGRLEDMAAVLTWLQALRAMAQAVVLVLSLVSPTLAAFFALAVMVMGLWLTLAFVAEALNFRSLFQALGVLVAVTLGLALGLMVFLTVTGFGVWGLQPYV